MTITNASFPSPFTDDLYTHVFSFLDEQSLVKASAVCTRWRVIINFCEVKDKLLWKALFERCYGYIPEILPTETFQKAYARRYSLFKNIQKSSTPTHSIPLPAGMTVNDFFTTTHFFFVTASNDHLTMLNSTLYCFDRTTGKEVSYIPMNATNNSRIYIKCINKDIITLRCDQDVLNAGNWQIFDVSQKNQATLLLTTTNILFNCHELPSEQLVYTDEEQHLCVYNTSTKTLRSLQTTLDTEEIRYSICNSHKLACLTNTHLVLIDLIEDTKCSLAYRDLNLTLPPDAFGTGISLPLLGQDTLFLFTQNNTLLIGHSSTHFFAVDMNTKKSQTISFPQSVIGMRWNEHFLVVKTKAGIYFWDLENFTPEYQFIEDATHSHLQLVSKEKALLVSNLTGMTTIWNLKTVTLEMRHPLGCTINESSVNVLLTSNKYYDESGIAWIHIENHGDRLNHKTASLYIDMQKSTIISEKKDHISLPHFIFRYPFFDSTSYGILNREENNRLAIKVFDLEPSIPQQENVTPLGFIQNGITATVKYIFGWG